MAFADFQQPPPGVQLLVRSLAGGRLGHAYLFAGDVPGDLETVARTLAKTLNCEAPRTRGVTGLALDSCDSCSSCRRIQAGNHPDVQWVRPESKSRVITIDQVRGLMQTVHLKPTCAEYKVGVVVAADRLNGQAANAFLKTLEEPPARSVLMLLSVDPEQILETIRSRCLRLNFAGDARRRIDAPVLAWLGSFSERVAAGLGGLWNRYQLLGMVQTKLGQIRDQVDQALTAGSPLTRYEEIDSSLREKWEQELSAAIEAEYRRRRTDLLAGLHGWFRDIWVAALGSGAGMACFPDLYDQAKAVARRVSAEAAAENLRVWEKTQRLLGSNIQEGLALEVGLLKLTL